MTRAREGWLRYATLTALMAWLVVWAMAQESKPWVAPPFAANRKNPVPADEQSIARGKQLYSTQCATCHGPEGKGNGPAGAQLSPKPTDLTTPQIAKETDGELFWKITEGRPPMPGFKQLSEEQRWDLVNFMRTLAPKKTEAQAGGAPSGDNRF